MAAANDFDSALAVDLGLHGEHLPRQRRLGKRKVKLRENRQVVGHRGRIRRHLCGQHPQNPFDLRALAGDELLELVADLHNRHRLHEDRRAGGGLIVHDARHHGAVLLLDRQDIPVAAHGDDRFLQIFGVRRAVDHAVQALAHALVAGAHLAADGKQLRAGAVRNLLLADDRIADGLLHIFERRQARGVCRDHRRASAVIDQRIAAGARRAQRSADVHQRARGQRRTDLRQMQLRANVGKRDHRRAAQIGQHVVRLARLLLHAAHILDAADRLQAVAQRRAHIGHAVLRKLRADLAEFEHAQGSLRHGLLLYSTPRARWPDVASSATTCTATPLSTMLR